MKETLGRYAAQTLTFVFHPRKVANQQWTKPKGTIEQPHLITHSHHVPLPDLYFIIHKFPLNPKQHKQMTSKINGSSRDYRSSSI